jgi:hypothetical protein
MSTLSHHTIMDQVKRNLAYELFDRYATEQNARRREDLYKFLMYESVPLTHELTNRLYDIKHTAMVVGRMRVPCINHENPRPKLTSFSPRGFLLFAKQMCMYLFMILFLKGLRRAVWMQDELQAMPVGLFDLEKSIAEAAKKKGGGH